MLLVFDGINGYVSTLRPGLRSFVCPPAALLPCCPTRVRQGDAGAEDASFGVSGEAALVGARPTASAALIEHRSGGCRANVVGDDRETLPTVAAS